MILGQAVHHPLQGHDAGGGEHACLAHAAAYHLARPARLGNERLARRKPANRPVQPIPC